MSKKKHFLERIVSGYWALGTLYKKSAPQAKTLAKNFVRSVTIFRPEKTTKIA